MDLSLTALLIIGLGMLCFFVPVQLGPPAKTPLTRNTFHGRSGITCPFFSG